MSTDEPKDEVERTARLALIKGRADLLVIQDLVTTGWEEATARELVQKIRLDLNRSQSMTELAHMDLEALEAQMDSDRQRDAQISARVARLALKGFPDGD